MTRGDQPMSREWNYGNREMRWDRWFGTFYDGPDAATQETRARKQRMYAR